MAKDVRFFFGRLNLIPTQEFERKRELLIDGLRYRATLTRQGIVWGFYGVGELSSLGRSFIHGFLVKYKQQTREEIVVPETGELDEQTINNLVSAKARFFSRSSRASSPITRLDGRFAETLFEIALHAYSRRPWVIFL